MLLKTLFWILWLVVLIPLSVDNYLSIPFRAYDIRVNYIGAAIICLLWLFTSYPWKELKSYFAQKWTWAMMGLGLVGLFGIIHSTNTERAIFFWIWSIGTLLGVPFLARLVGNQLGHWLPRSVILYTALNGLIILIDGAFLCIPTQGQWHLGRVMIYQGAVGNLCRPHAFYQEPGYYAAFALLILPLTSLWLEQEVSRAWRNTLRISYYLIVAAIALTTSRMGWLGLLVVATFEIIRFLRQNRLQLPCKNLAPLIAALALVAIGTSAFAVKYVPIIYAHVGRGLINPGQDGSFEYRVWRLKMGWKVFQDNSLVGAGPGSAAAYLVDKYSEEIDRVDPTREKVGMRNDPLSMNLYTELLSEWGGLGTLAFFAGVILLLWPLPLLIRIQTLGLLAVIYTSTQTLPRFDLWLALGCLSLTLFSRPLDQKARPRPSVQ